MFGLVFDLGFILPTKKSGKFPEFLIFMKSHLISTENSSKIGKLITLTNLNFRFSIFPCLKKQNYKSYSNLLLRCLLNKQKTNIRIWSNIITILLKMPKVFLTHNFVKHWLPRETNLRKFAHCPSFTAPSLYLPFPR